MDKTTTPATVVVPTAARLIEFLGQLGKRGDINPSTAVAWATTVKKVLSIESNWEEIDMSQVDVEEYLTRFKNLKRLEYSDGSMDEYSKRFRRSVSLFLDYSKNPSTWKAPAKLTAGRKPDASEGDKSAKQAPRRAVINETPKTLGVSMDADSPAAHGESAMVDYPFPLRDRCIARLRLPVDLRTSEVERLTAFMRSIAIAPNDDK